VINNQIVGVAADAGSDGNKEINVAKNELVFIKGMGTNTNARANCMDGIKTDTACEACRTFPILRLHLQSLL